MQWHTNGGKCGLCGDNYADPTPRKHELHGKFGEGIIVKSYTRGTVLSVKVQITANHRGYFLFSICNLDESNETEECFNRIPLFLVTGADRFVLPTQQPGRFVVDLRLPSNLVCNHCVLRWRYVAGNNWGPCPNGGGALGCGPQENFLGCSDIRIY